MKISYWIFRMNNLYHSVRTELIFNSVSKPKKSLIHLHIVALTAILKILAQLLTKLAKWKKIEGHELYFEGICYSLFTHWNLPVNIRCSHAGCAGAWMESCDNYSWKQTYIARADCDKEYGTLWIGLDKAQPCFIWIKCEKTYVLQLQTNEVSFCMAHTAMG